MKMLMYCLMYWCFFLWSVVVVVVVIVLVLFVQVVGLCFVLWVYDGSCVCLDGNGKMLMIVEFILYDVNCDMQDGCEIGLYIYVKLGLVVFGGWFIEMVQEYQLLVDEVGVVMCIVSINGWVFV